MQPGANRRRMSCTWTDQVDLARNQVRDRYGFDCEVHGLSRKISVEFAAQTKEALTEHIYRPIRIWAEWNKSNPGNAGGANQLSGGRLGVERIQIIGEICYVIAARRTGRSSWRSRARTETSGSNSRLVPCRR
jgi:hypothetical protein